MAKSPLLDTIVGAISNEDCFEQAVDCMSAMYRDTREVDESMDAIEILYPRVLALRPTIKAAVYSEDPDMLKGVTRLFAEAGEAWVVLTARMPQQFRGLVEAILECCAGDTDREAAAVTFYFWYDLKQMLTVEKFVEARNNYTDIYSDLVDVMTKHLQFPVPTGPNPKDCFDGDREQEEMFRSFRHDIGDVLKSCCEVIGISECLGKSFDAIKTWISKYGSQATSSNFPHWQELEAPLFALRGMGRMVPKDESIVMHQVIPLIVQIPAHSKIRFQTVMALGRYTEWTAEHPDFLQMQLQYIIAAFKDASDEVMQAAALAFRFFGFDCKKLLQHELENLHGFYDSILDKLAPSSQDDLTEGVAAVISGQPNEKIYSALKLYCDPIVERLKQRANKAQQAPDDTKLEVDVAGWLASLLSMEPAAADLNIADTLALLTIIFRGVQPYYSPSETNQAVTYCQEILPVLATVGSSFPNAKKTLESLCRCWREMVLSYRTAALPLLPTLAEQLAVGFETTRQGCFLWTTDAVLREFSIGAEFVGPSTTQAVYSFFEQQAFAFLRIMNDLPPQELPDGKPCTISQVTQYTNVISAVIEDFFRLLTDALIYHHEQLLPAAIMTPIFSAALSALSLEQEPPLTATLHFLRDLLSYGTDRPNSSSFTTSPPPSPTSTKARAAAEAGAKNQAAVKALIAAQGAQLTQRLLTGMMFHFPRDCLPDASGALLDLVHIAPHDTAGWLRDTLGMLPPGSLKPGEGERLLQGIASKLQAGEPRKVRVLLQDFTTGYRRRHVVPREGLGRLEPERFRFSG